MGSALAWDTSPQTVTQMHTQACPWLASWPGVAQPKGDWEHEGTLAQPPVPNLRGRGSAAPIAAFYDLRRWKRLWSDSKSKKK